ncbi:MAG: hypothetical protein ACI4O4_02230 [Candidatus Ventricola sp.]
MIYAGIRAESFAGVKVTDAKDRFVADRELQTVRRAGNIVSSISVPTVREIIVDMLVRANHADELMLTMDKLAKWLEGAGTARLELEQTEGTYYKARCTGMGDVTYSGPNARFTVTFICMDYRQYNAYNDQPVSGADPSSDNFTFAGMHCLNDMGCMFVMDKRMGVPAVTISKYDVLGIPGTLRYDQNDLILSEQQISGKLYFVNRAQDGEILADEEIEERLHAVSSWLILAGRAPLILDSDVTRQYLAEIENAADFTRIDWENGRLELKMTLQPYSLDTKAASMTKTVSLSANTAQTVDLSALFPRGVGFITPLIVEIKNTGSSAITALEIGYTDRLGAARTARLEGGGFSLSAGQTVQVDGEEAGVTIAGQNAMLGFTGDFPSVSPDPGNLAVSLKSGTSASVSITVKARARWL